MNLRTRFGAAAWWAPVCLAALIAAVGWAVLEFAALERHDATQTAQLEAIKEQLNRIESRLVYVRQER